MSISRRRRREKRKPEKRKPEKRKLAKRKPARRSRKSRLTVYTNGDTEIFVIDGSLGVRHHGVGHFDELLSPGLYKVRVVRGGGNREQLVDLDKAQSVTLYCESFPAVAPIGPMLGAAVPEVEHLARSAVVTSRKKWPAEGILVVAHGGKRKRSEDERLLQGITLKRWADPERQLTPAAVRPRATICDEDWEARWWQVEPGSYVLGYQDGTRRVEQALLVADRSATGQRWQTRVFLRESVTGTSRHISSSIQMARFDQEVVYYDHYETIEIARNALERDRPIVSDWLIDNLLYGKFENPVMGFVGLHLLLSALEDERAGKRSALSARRLKTFDRVIDEVLCNLEMLLGGTPPDLIALQVRAGRLKGAHVANVTEPPMFWKSWDVLRQNTDEGEPVVIGRDLWDRISLSAPAGPYFAWQARADATSIPARYALPFESLTALSVPLLGAKSLGFERAPGGSALGLVAPEQLSAREMAKTLGIPLSVLAELRDNRALKAADIAPALQVPITTKLV